jgi:hypothetical protein
MLDERPRIRVLMALPRIMSNALPWRTAVVDLFDVPFRQRGGWQFVAVDPADEDAWQAWRARHPEVGAE